MKCKICDSETRQLFSAVILKKYNTTYYKCINCGFIQTEEPYWLSESYELPINKTDVGLFDRNIRLAKITRLLFSRIFDKGSFFLDYGGGYGILTRLMRNYGLLFFNTDVYVKNIFSPEFNYEKEEKISAVTCFECFEHFKDPRSDLSKILQISDNIFFSTLLVSRDSLNKNWWYYGFHHGQHISFYTKKSLTILAGYHGLHYYTNGKNLHLFTSKKISWFLWQYLFLIYKISLIINFELFFKRDE